MKLPDYYICIPVYNEEKRLYRCIKNFNEAIILASKPLKTIICLNGCTDNSKEVAKKCYLDFPQLGIEVITSKKGKINAQEKILKFVKPGKVVFFTDSDTFIEKDAIKNILKELKKNSELIVVGGFPVAVKYSGLNPIKTIFDRVLNIRSRYPMVEISKLDVSKYHRLAVKDPQCINTSPKHELQSKIFFHGRLFALKSKKYWDKPNLRKGVIGDDSYIPDYIIYNYGKSRIRIRYDSIVYYDPFISLSEHYRTYKRTYFDLNNLRKGYPEFTSIRDHSSLKLDWNYIQKLTPITRIYFRLFSAFRKIETILFNKSKDNLPSKIWIKN